MGLFVKKRTMWAIGILSIFLLVGSGCQTDEKSANEVKSGTYSATTKGFHGDVGVEVTVDDKGKITELVADVGGETPELGGEAGPKVAKEIVEKQSLDIEAVSGASITSKAVVDATETALKESGMDTEKLKGKKQTAGENEEITTDIVVVGAGASGTAAAAAAIDGGAKVVMLEKTKDVGGISKFFAGGPFAVESHLQKEAGKEYDIKKEDVLQTLNDYAHYINYGPLTKAIVYKSGDTIEWMEKWGVDFHVNEETPQIAHQDDDMKWRLYHWYDLFSYEPTDKAAIDVVHEKLADAGLEVKFNTTAEKLLKDKEGNVIGVEATKEDGSKLTVHAKSVILGTGGFAGNPDMMEEYYNTDALGQWGEDGAGVKMAWDAGAAKWDTASSLLHGNGMVAPSKESDVTLSTSPFNQIVRSPLLWIDRGGNRYCNEEAVWDTALSSNAAYSVGGIYYIVVDKATLDSYTKGKPLVMDTAVGGPNMDKADFVELAEEGVKQGIITKGETIEELAKRLDVEKSTLQTTVEDYNTAIKTKEDAYGKSKDSLVYGIEEGPFYAVKMQISNLGTLGGVRVNDKLQATDENLKPISGLYVVGNDAAGFYGNNTAYPPYEGLATGFAWNSGRIAGEDASSKLKE